MFVLILALWCGGIILISKLANGWRQAAQKERQGDGPANGPLVTEPWVPEPPRTRARPAGDASSTKHTPSGRIHELPELPERPGGRNRAA